MNWRYALVFTAAAFASTSLGCGSDEQPYAPKPAVSGKKPALPAVPTLPTKQKKQGDAYTIWGITHDLHSRVHAEEVVGKKVSIVGYVVRTNYEAAPKCAIHKTGKGDPPECKSPVPTFSIADEKGETKEIDADGLLARALQHEIDHLNGVLFIDHISKLKRDRVTKKFTKAAKANKRATVAG